MNKGITTKQFIERLPSGYITKKQELLDELTATAVAPPVPAGSPVAAPPAESEDMAVKGGSGNGALQRALNREGV